MFSLVKWYGDVVTDEGTAAIIYAARLRWGLLRVKYASIQYFPVGMPGVEQATVRHVELPQLEGGVLRWRSEPLGVQARWYRDAPAIERQLARGPDGTVQWHCHMPRARGEVQLGETRIEGLGYVEALHLTVPPWKLGLRTLHWGRHLSPEHWLVWIAWWGAEERCWAWLDGVEQPCAVPHEAGLVGLTESRRLLLGRASDLRDRPVLTTIHRSLPGLARRLAGALGRLHEHKRLSPSSIVFRERPLDHGWTVYEEVTW